MNKKDINQFKRFLQNHGMNTMFAGLYNQFKYDDNPDTVQEYLESVPRIQAISYAFDISMIRSDNYGAKFWSDLDRKWRNFINKTDERKSFEIPEMDHELREIKREERFDEQMKVENEWSGLDLVNINVTAQRKVPMPEDCEVRINTKNKNVVVLNSHITNILENSGFDSMSINVDRNTNRQVWVFGKDMKFNISKYSTDTKCLNGKAIIEYLEKYLEVKFDPEKYYYVKIASKVWSNNHSYYARVLSQRFTEKKF